jgi:hypothetical protein
MRLLLLLLFLSELVYATLYEGIIVDKITQKPIHNATITAKHHVVKSDLNGKFQIDNDKESLSFRALGYKRLSSSMHNINIIELEPIQVKSLYLSYWALDSAKYRREILALAKKTEINSIVLDIKNSYGDVAFRGTSDMAKKSGAYKRRTLKDVDRFITKLKALDLYLIARVVLFKDNYFAKTYPHDALQKANGEIWKNSEGMSWANPYSNRAHRYNLEISKDIAKKGFDEIQFDYVRFPAYKDINFSHQHTQKKRVNTIISFLKKARKALTPYNVFISIDTYGYACWHEGDTGIGHELSKLAPYTDYISPMLYPSSFHVGVLGLPKPLENPYKVIYDSIVHSSKRSNIDPIQFRPWLQAFRDYAFDKRAFKEEEIRAQIEASQAANTSGWMLWNPLSKYTTSGLLQDTLYKVSLKEKKLDAMTDLEKEKL